jgi:hypothetical protein
MSALPPKADINSVFRDVRFVPLPGIVGDGEPKRVSTILY